MAKQQDRVQVEIGQYGLRDRLERLRERVPYYRTHTINSQIQALLIIALDVEEEKHRLDDSETCDRLKKFILENWDRLIDSGWNHEELAQYRDGEGPKKTGDQKQENANRA
jgi:hypothetical protein